MSRQRSLVSRGVVALCLAVAAVLAAGPLASGAPANKRVNNPAGDTAPVIDQGDPVFTTGSDGLFFAIWEDPPGHSDTTSRIGVARTTPSGVWTDLGQVPQGLEDFISDPRLGSDPANAKVYIVLESCFRPAHKCPVAVVSTDDYGDTWNKPVDTFTSIQTDDKEFATNPDIAIDASSNHPGRVYIIWTDFLLTPASASRLVIQYSDDAGVKWSPPVQISDSPMTFAENARVVVDRKGNVFVTYLDYDATNIRYSFVSKRSADGGATWSKKSIIAPSIQSTGVLKNCGTAAAPRSKAVLNGDIDTFPVPDLAISPSNDNLYVAYQAPGPGTNLPDVYYSRSTDGGSTWSSPVIVGGNPRDQFRPAIEAGPAGQVALAWYDRRNDPGNLKTDVYAAFSTNNGASFGALERVTSQSFAIPKLNPNYDTSRQNCDFPGRIDIAFPGSGAYLMWGDMRDAGPAGNNGVDPNIYFAHVPIPTTISAVVTRAATTRVVAGAVSPALPGGKVTATLYRKVAGKFVKVTTKSGTLNSSSKYAFSFTPTAAGSCQVIVKFAGNAEYLASSVTKTFNC